MSVIVTNANSSKALTVTRSLGKKGIDVITTDSKRFSPSFFSKYSTNHFTSSSPKIKPDEYINQLLNYVKKNNVDVLMPVKSTDTLLISKYKHKFTPYTKVPFQDYSKMIQLNDKKKLVEIASEIDIPIPKTYNIINSNDISNVAKDISYPAVIKLKNATSSIGISYAQSENELILKYNQTILKYNLTKNDYPLIQEYIPGDGYGVSALFNQGDLRAIFTHKRLREYPITGGPSTMRISVQHPEMEKIAVNLLKHVGWHGLAMVEFKLDRRTNKPYLLEVNPRFWGSINQAVSSGVDFPYLLYQMAMDGDVKPVLNYKIGVKTRSLFNDFRSLISHLKNSNNHFQMIKEFVNFRDDNMYYDELSKDDILPAIMFFYRGIGETLGVFDE